MLDHAGQLAYGKRNGGCVAQLWAYSRNLHIVFYLLFLEKAHVAFDFRLLRSPYTQDMRTLVAKCGKSSNFGADILTTV